MIRYLATAALSCAAIIGPADAADPHYQTKTPYQPQQPATSYQGPPPGYRAVYTQMLARHGSRGLSSFKSDLAFYNLWLLARQDNALTPLGAQLGPDIERLMRANFVLGYGVAGITRPGYGNETMQGIAEHTALARRLRERLPQLFADAEANQSQLVVVTSGKDRAVDSGQFFVQSLLAQQPGLAPDIVYPTSLAPRAERDHASRPAGTDRFLLYFHKLTVKQDEVKDPADPLFQAWQDSVAYQDYVKSAALRASEQAILAEPRVAVAARAALARLFTPVFIAQLDQGQHNVANSGSRSYSSADGKFSSTLEGDGDTRIRNATDAALMLYELYAAASNMRSELAAINNAGHDPAQDSGDFTRYLLPEQAAVFASVDDATAFYAKGPASIEDGAITSRMARTLLEDFFSETDAIVRGDRAHAAKLRFAHAEIVIPLATLLGVPGMSEALPRGVPYSYASSAWRGANVAPMAANIQWDVYQADGKPGALIRMLYNEREADFKPACDAARVKAGSHYYDAAQLKNCYKSNSTSAAASAPANK